MTCASSSSKPIRTATPLRSTAGDPTQKLLVAEVAGAENHELQLAVQQGGGGARDDVDPLLVDQAGDHSEHRAAAVRQLEASQQVGLAGPLACGVVRRVAMGKVGVDGRVPHVVVGAVQHPP